MGLKLSWILTLSSLLLRERSINTGKLLSGYRRFCVSIITYMEVYGYEFENEEEKELIDRLFEELEVVDIDRSIANQTITYRKNKRKKIKLPDAIILATAKYTGADLVTDDWDDFQGIDDTVIVKDVNDIKA